MRNTTGAKAKNILIFFASSGICENAIKPVGQKKELDLLVLLQKNQKIKSRGVMHYALQRKPRATQVEELNKALKTFWLRNTEFRSRFQPTICMERGPGSESQEVFPVPKAL